MSSRKNHTGFIEPLERRLALSGVATTPRISSYTSIKVDEDTRTPVYLRVADTPNSKLTVVIRTDEGTLHAGPNPQMTLRYSGTPKQINNQLRSLSYQTFQDSNRPSTITVTTSNGAKTATQKIAVSVRPINDAPVISQKDTEISGSGDVFWRDSMFSDVDSKSIRVTIRSDAGTVRIEDPRAKMANGAARINGEVESINRLFSMPRMIKIDGAPKRDAKITIKVSDGALSVEKTVTAFATESVATHARAAVNARIAGKDPAASKHIFSVADHKSASYTRNKGNWAADLDLTPISPWNSYGGNFMAGTLVSPRHVLYATHFAMPIGTKIRFVTKDNQVVERTIVNAVSPRYTGVYFPDITVGLLDSDVPESIGFAKVLPENWPQLLESSPDIPCLALDQEEKALVTSLQYIDAYAAFDAPRDQTQKSFFESIISGDSGNPAFMIVDNQMVLLTVWTFGYGGSGTSVAHQRDQINKMMSELGGGYQLSPADFGRFRKL